MRRRGTRDNEVGEGRGGEGRGGGVAENPRVIAREGVFLFFGDRPA